jgi:hypothetical protein
VSGVPLSPFTVLVGGNGVGKSSVLEAMADLSRGQGRACVSDIRAWDSVVRRGATVASARFRTSLRTVAIERIDDDRYPRLREALEPEWCRGVELSLSPKLIAVPSPVSKTQPDFDGFGTASTWAHLKLNNLDRFNRGLDRTRKIVPLVRDFGLTVASVEEEVEDRRIQPRSVAYASAVGDPIARCLVCALGPLLPRGDRHASPHRAFAAVFTGEPVLATRSRDSGVLGGRLLERLPSRGEPDGAVDSVGVAHQRPHQVAPRVDGPRGLYREFTLRQTLPHRRGQPFVTMTKRRRRYNRGAKWDRSSIGDQEQP